MERKVFLMRKHKTFVKKIVLGGVLAAAFMFTSISNPVLPSETAVVTAASRIGVKKAKSIALKHAGLKSSQVKFLKAKLDYDDGRAVYEIEFYRGSTEYDYEIDAKTGKILSYDHDIEDYESSKASTKISAGKAKKIALKHAGLKESQVKGLKVSLDTDDGKKVYEVEFRKGKYEYSYEISASTGKILDYEKEYDD